MPSENEPLNELTLEQRVSAVRAPEPTTEQTTEENTEIVNEEENKIEEEITNDPASEPESQTTAENAEPAPESSEIETIEDIALALDKPLSDVMNLIKVTRKVNGVESQITLQEAVNDNIAQADYTRSKMELSDQRKAFETEQDKYRLEQEARITQTTALYNHVENKFTEEYKAIDWNDLRLNDPAEYAAKQQDMTNKQSEIQNLRQQIATEANQVATERQDKLNVQRQEYALAERAKLIESVPEFAKTDVMNTELSKVASYLASIGYNNDEINNTMDHRHILLIRKAMMYDESVKNVDIAKNKVKKVPRLVKAGTSSKSITTQKQGQVDAIKSAKKTGSLNDAAARLAMIRGG